MPTFINQPLAQAPRRRELDFSPFTKLIDEQQKLQKQRAMDQNAAQVLEQAQYGQPAVNAMRGGDRGLAAMLIKQRQIEAQQQAQAQARAAQEKFRMMQFEQQNRQHSDNLGLRRDQLEQSRKSNEINSRIQAAKLQQLEQAKLGITPKSIAEDRSKIEKTQNIQRGIEQLAGIPEWAKTNNRDFDGAIGPVDSSIAGRALGYFDPSEGEVRRKIAGDTEALAAAIKPLIRKPGEGAWTDKDQERLVSVVGDLIQAKDTNEYRRALAGVRERINSNFGLNIPRLSFEEDKIDSIRSQAPSGTKFAKGPNGQMIMLEPGATEWKRVQ